MQQQWMRKSGRGATALALQFVARVEEWPLRIAVYAFEAPPSARFDDAANFAIAPGAGGVEKIFERLAPLKPTSPPIARLRFELFCTALGPAGEVNFRSTVGLRIVFAPSA